MDISGYPFETRAAQSITESVAHIPGLLTYARTRVETSFFFLPGVSAAYTSLGVLNCTLRYDTTTAVLKSFGGLL